MNRKLYSILITALLLAVGFGSCGESKLGPELVRINSIADGITGAHTDEDKAKWHTADSLLRSTDTSRLPENDRMYHSLLRVKVTDKAYLSHPGDTIIRPVVEYAEEHKDCGFLAEALYYAGRVYSDMGDSFTSLSYFQKALDNLPENERNRNLRCRILSQTSALLNSLRLYNEAIAPLEDCIVINKFLKDSLNLFYNYQDLSAFNLHLQNFDRAEYLLKESLTYSGAVTRDDSLVAVTYLAGVKEVKNNIDSALLLIRGIPEQVTDSLTRNMVLAYASDIYRKAGISDTSFIYARELIRNGNPNNKIIGYQNLLKLIHSAKLPVDSLIYYVRSYAQEMERYLNTNGDKLALMQQAQYNYSLHDRMRREEEGKASLNFYLWVGTLTFSIVSIAIFWRYKTKRKKDLLKANKKINLLTERIEKEALEKEKREKEILMDRQLAKEQLDEERLMNSRLEEKQRKEMLEIEKKLEKERKEKEQLTETILKKNQSEEALMNKSRVEKELLENEWSQKVSEIKEMLRMSHLEKENLVKELLEKHLLINQMMEKERINSRLMEKKLSEKRNLEMECREKERIVKRHLDEKWDKRERELHESRDRSLAEIEQLREKYLDYGLKAASLKQGYEVPEKILKSRAFKRLVEMIRKGSKLSDLSRLWEDLDNAISNACPDYKRDLMLLMGGKVSKTHLQTIILIKCGFKTADIAKALKITSGAVSSRRQEISDKIFRENKGTAVIDAIIHSL